MSKFDDDIVEMICQIAQMRRSCDLCQKEDHLILNCPRLRNLKSDPVKVRRMICTIGSLLGISHEAFSMVLGTTNPKSSPRPGSALSSTSKNRDATPPRSNVMNTRQILDGERTDDESVIRQLNSDVRSLNDTDEETDQDFWMAGDALTKDAMIGYPCLFPKAMWARGQPAMEVALLWSRAEALPARAPSFL